LQLPPACASPCAATAPIEAAPVPPQPAFSAGPGSLRPPRVAPPKQQQKCRRTGLAFWLSA
jgi:hypothetical protein